MISVPELLSPQNPVERAGYKQLRRPWSRLYHRVEALLLAEQHK